MSGVMANVDFEDDTKDAVEGFNGEGPLAVLDFRYKKMLGTESIPLSLDINGSDALDSVPTELKFAAGVAAYGMVLRDSKYKVQPHSTWHINSSARGCRLISSDTAH